LQLVRTQESERRHIARELHDEIGQSLTAAQLNLQALLGISDLSELPARLEDSLGLIDRVLQQVRALSLDLRPSMLDDLGLVPALRWYLNRQAERAGFSVELHTDQMLERFAPDLETTCFRIAQEALNNIVRYARAKYVVVELHQRDNVLQLTISDDGVGFDVGAARRSAATGGSLGLVSMQERAVLVGGLIEFDSTPDRGTTIVVQLPLTAPQEAARHIERRSSSR
jgi:signal transduction histidine kinase